MKILMPVDGSDCSNAAVAFVASRGTLAAAISEVELFNVQLPIPPRAARIAGREMVRSFHESEAGSVLRSALTRLRKAGVAASSRFAVGSPGAAVAAAAAASDADLVVMGSHGHTALKGLLFGSVTNAVLAGSSKPLLVVRGTAAPKRASLAVGIALDGSRCSMAAARYALKHRQLFGTAPRFVLIHVVPDLAAIVIPGFGDAPAPLYSAEKILAAQSAAFDRVVAPVRRLFERNGLDVEAVCRSANAPGDEIAAFAKRHKLDMLVMGSRGLGAVQSVVLGSVAARVAARCATPLLLVREK